RRAAFDLVNIPHADFLVLIYAGGIELLARDDELVVRYSYFLIVGEKGRGRDAVDPEIRNILVPGAPCVARLRHRDVHVTVVHLVRGKGDGDEMPPPCVVHAYAVRYGDLGNRTAEKCQSVDL